MDRVREELGASQPGPQLRDRRHFAGAKRVLERTGLLGTSTSALMSGKVSGPGRSRPAAPVAMPGSQDCSEPTGTSWAPNRDTGLTVVRAFKSNCVQNI